MTRAGWTLVAAIALAAVVLFAPAIRQDQSYHHFADERTLFGIPNFWNVISNAPFAIVGAIGLARLRDRASRMMFAGIFLTAFGSAYYHWSPNDSTLVWDRLPMTMVFMTIFAIVIGLEKRLIVFVLIGVASVFWWSVTGNLVPYVLVQFLPMFVIPVVLAVRGPKALWPVVACYAAAKILEAMDVQVASHFPLSGHTLKHFAAAGATWFIFAWRRITT